MVSNPVAPTTLLIKAVALVRWQVIFFNASGSSFMFFISSTRWSVALIGILCSAINEAILISALLIAFSVLNAFSPVLETIV